MSRGDRFLRAAGIGFCGAVMVWLVGLSVAFIAEDAVHAKAHLTQQRGQVAWIGVIIVLSIIPVLVALLFAALHEDK